MCTYDLKYNDYNSNVSDGLRSLLATSDISDITLAVEGKFFKAHQVILSIFSPYFRKLFCVNPSKHTIFFMKNVKYRIMHNLLAFMYEGMVQIPGEDFNLFCETANELKIKGLSNDAEPHSMTTLSQVPVESAQVVGIDGKQSTKETTPILSSYLKRLAESVQTSPAGTARKKSKVAAAVQLESAPEVNDLASAIPSTSWDPAPLECVQEDLPIIDNAKKEVDSYGEESIHFMQNEDAIDLDIKYEPEEIRHLEANEGHSVSYQTPPKENILSSAGPSTSWHPAPHECAEEVLPMFVTMTGDTNVQTRDEVDRYSEDDTTNGMQNEDCINLDGSSGDTTCDIKWEREDASDDNLLVPLCEANAGQPGDNMIFHAEDATNRILPNKAKERYEYKYVAYCTWRNEHGARRTTEDVFVAHLTERSKHVNTSSLWSEYSMLKAMIKLKENVDVKEMLKVQRFLKQNSKKSYTPKRSKTFTEKEFIQFLKYAPDEMYLMMKTALIIGIYGACKRCELANLEMEQVNICDGYLLVTMQQANNLVPRTFTVPNSIIDGIQMAGFVTRYISLRPALTPHKRLFLFYSKGKCTTTPVGINTFGKIPANVATFLNLPKAKLYTGNCFRRTSAMMLANAGAESKIIISKQTLQPCSDSD